MEQKYDFCGWATRNDLECSDGRIIRQNAFVEQDGEKVPLVWNHQHNDPRDVLGYAILKNKPQGVYTYGYFNDTPDGKLAKALVKHHDIDQLSIYANRLTTKGPNVVHGKIREVSLVHAGANPKAFIENVVMHSDGTPNMEEGVIYAGEYITEVDPDDISHSDTKVDDHGSDIEPANGSDKDPKIADNPADNITHSEGGPTMADQSEKKEKTVKEVFDELTDEQKNVVYFMMGKVMEEQGDGDNEGDEDMKHNVFDNEVETNEDVISHSDMMEVINDAKRYGSMRESALQHGMDDITYIAHAGAKYGIVDSEGNPNPDLLFPDYKSLNNPPMFIQRDMGWVSKVMGRVHHTPFSRIKSLFADITEDDARAKGYIKGKMKKEEFFSLVKRTTDPTTVYKKQKMDRDDVIDITDFDVIAWLKSEMRMMLDEELARAILVGDGRSPGSDDHIKEDHIRPIWKDNALYTIKTVIEFAKETTEAAKAKQFIRAAIKSRKDYKGSGNPVLFASEDIITECLLLEDTTGRLIYDSISKLATTLRVSEIISTPVMEGLTRVAGEGEADQGTTHNLMGIIVNLSDYNVGADKGGAVSMFDDFDIDYNQQKYLIETRCSGALTRPYSAIAIESKEASPAMAAASETKGK